MHLSIVTSMYKSEPYIGEFYNRLKNTVESLTNSYEIIFVNDGSPDDCGRKVYDFCLNDKRVRLVDLSRNFGHHKALMTGLNFAKGDLIFLIDNDLEEDPELLNIFYKNIQESNVDVVYGIQKSRKGGLFEKISGHFFYDIFNMYSDIKIPKNLLTVRLMTRRYVDNLIQYKEQGIFLAGLMEHAGFSKMPIEVKKHHKGRSTYSFTRKISLLVNAITSFSSKPLVLIFQTGVAITGFTFVYIIYTLIKKLFLQIDVPGFTSIIIAIFLFSGIIILFLGIIGIYISKIFIETKDRPYTVIREIVNPLNTDPEA